MVNIGIRLEWIVVILLCLVPALVNGVAALVKRGILIEYLTFYEYVQEISLEMICATD